MKVDIKIVQLLCSRLCHDLVGPTGAVHNGVELLEEMGTDDGGDALKMVSASVEQLSARLAFFRMAFGLGGLSGRNPPLVEVRSLAGSFLAVGRVTLDWPVEEATEPAPEISVTALKLLLNMILVATDALPRGGSIRVKLASMNTDQGGPAFGMAVRACGDGARLKEELMSALSSTPGEGTSAELNAYNVHGYFCRRLAEHLSSDFEISKTDNEVQFAVLVPA